MGRIIRPLETLTAKEKKQPLIFLAGPIKGGGGWQERAIQVITGVEPKVNIASPHSLPDSPRVKFEEQFAWECEHLDRAAHTGCILFCLTPEVKSEHRRDRAYAQTTRIELGLWLARYEAALAACGEGDDITFRVPGLVIGFEDAGSNWAEGFSSRRMSGEKYLRLHVARIAQEQETHPLLLCEGLWSACNQAMRIALQRYYATQQSQQ